MKKYIVCFLTACLMAVPVATEAASTNADEISDAITIEELQKISTPQEMLQYKSGVCVEYLEKYEEQSLEVIRNYGLKDGIYYYNFSGTYDCGLRYEEYEASDPEDLYVYIVDDDDVAREPITLDNVDTILNRSVFNFQLFDPQLVSVEEAEAEYIAEVEYTLNDQVVERDMIHIDAESGYVTSADLLFIVDGEEFGSREVTITYSDDITVDDAAKKAYDELPEEEKAALEDNGKVTFHTTDLDGNEVTEEIMKDAKVVMVNFWEPWCGPCVGEMPDLEKLYEKYSSEGLLILGVYSSDVEDARMIVEKSKVTYPIILCDKKLSAFQTDYVPTTIFADAEGNVISDEPVVGANSYEAWEQILEAYLN